MKNFSEEIFNGGFGFDGPHLVAASAGTGKTYSIQNIYARLVVEKELRVSEILVMTFTEKATKELKDRVRKVLGNLSLLFAGREDEIVDDKGRKDDMEIERLCNLRACARTSIGGESPDAVARLRIEAALMEFDLAAVHTIHGFCRRALSRHAFETGAPFNVELTETDEAVLDRMARDWWRTSRGNVPESVRAELDLGILSVYVRKLAAKPDAHIAADDGTAAGYMLTEAKKIADAYHAARDARRTRTFDELLLSLRDALRGESGASLAAHLRKEFRAVVVDEFQDTDPVQYEIFRRVFLDVPADVDKPVLFFVGDPKQAIYSFRGGDIFTYRAAAGREDVKANAFRLEKNFRSTPRLIEAVNLIFKDHKDENGQTHYTFGDSTIDYPDDLKADEKKPAFQIKGRDDPKPFRVIRVKNHRPKGATEGLTVAQGVNEAVVESVLDVLEEQRGCITPKDIAILVTGHGKADQLRSVLAERGIPVVLQHAGNVFGQPVAREFLTLLQAMALDGGMGRVRAAMLTPFFDFTPAELDSDAAGETLADAVSMFKELNGIWLKKGFDAAMAALENFGRCDFHRRFAVMPDGERRLADTLQLIDLSIATVRAKGPSPDVLISWVAERIGNAGTSEERSEEFARELESEHDAVKIMTMFVSKGLEFPVVIVPLPANDKAEQNNMGPYGFHGNGGADLVYSPDREPGYFKEQKEERARLLYVAMTRATKRTVVVVPDKVPDSWPVEELLANAERNGGMGDDGPISVVNDFLPKEMSDYLPPRYDLGVEKPVVERAAFDTAPSKGSYSSLSPGGKDNNGRDHDNVGKRQRVPDKEKLPVFALGGGAKVGTCWHEILEKIDFAVDDAVLLQATQEALTLHGLPMRDAPTVAGMMREALNFQIVGPDGKAFSLRDVSVDDRISEWEFDFSSRDAEKTTASLKDVIKRHWAGDPKKQAFIKAMERWDRQIPRGFLQGFLDLVFRHGGYYYVVDWKSNIINGARSGFTEKGVREEMAEHWYFFQYLLYAAVLHRFLKETLGAGYSWERNFGGIRYYFLRGVAAGCKDAVFADRPCKDLLDELAVALGMEENR